jgi:hypothetical protein
MLNAEPGTTASADAHGLVQMHVELHGGVMQPFDFNSNA